MKKTLARTFTGLHARLYLMTGGRGMGGGEIADGNVLVLHHTGAKTGRQRDTPLQYLVDGDRFFLVASAGGAPNHPGWYHNLVANPDAEVTIANKRHRVRARVAAEAERAGLWARFVETDDRFGRYADRTDREIPVVVLERVGGGGGASW